MNLFDGMQKTAFAVVATTMGYQAVWTTSAGGLQQTATVLFKDASQTAKLLEIEYDPQRAMIEYFDTDLTGLKAAVDAKTDEFIFVNGVQYGINEIRAKWDGKTMHAHLQLI